MLKKNRIKILSGMRLDFGAIAKGYAIDKAYEVLVAFGHPIALVDGGGDIYIGESPPAQPGWEIKMRVKDLRGSWIDSMVYVHSASIVTSGDEYKFIEDLQGHRYSHIINPRTGYGIPGPHLTTVIAENGTHADALATTLSILNDNQIKRFKKKWKKSFKEISADWQYWIFRPQT